MDFSVGRSKKLAAPRIRGCDSGTLEERLKSVCDATLRNLVPFLFLRAFDIVNVAFSILKGHARRLE